MIHQDKNKITRYCFDFFHNLEKKDT